MLLLALQSRMCIYIWSYLDPTRLETRSKESSVDAWVFNSNFPNCR